MTQEQNEEIKIKIGKAEKILRTREYIFKYIETMKLVLSDNFQEREMSVNILGHLRYNSEDCVSLPKGICKQVAALALEQYQKDLDELEKQYNDIISSLTPDKQ